MIYQAPDIRLFTLLPFAVLTVSALVVLMAIAFGSREERRLVRLTLGGLAATGVALVVAMTARHIDSFGGMLVMDRSALWFAVVFVATTAATVALAAEHLRTEGTEHREIYALLLISCLGMMFMAAGGNLVVIFIGLETMSVTLYVMAALGGLSDERANEAALKYLLLGAFATGFLVYGMAFLYGGAGTLDLRRIAAAASSGEANTAYLTIGLALMAVGLGFKVALVPFHMWAPDVYEGSPTVVTAFMAVGPKVAGFAALLRVFHVAGGPLAEHWAPVIAALAVLTMLVGNLAALAQTNIKRLLAFSSIAHAGYLLLGVLSPGSLGMEGVLYYSLTYAFLSLAAFAVVLAVHGPGNDRLDIGQLAGLGRRSPFLAVCMTVALLGMAGLPPFSGFVGKLLLFRAAVVSGHVMVAALGILCSVISVFYYFRLIRLMTMEPPREDAVPLEVGEFTRRTLWVTLAGTALLSIPLCVAVWPLVEWCSRV